MPTPNPSLHLWLPALAHLEPGHPLREWLPRADRLPDGAIGYLDGLGAHFSGVDANVPAAAITREFLAGDAADELWLAADPAWVQPDMNGVRLLACGRMQLDMAAAQALAEPLRAVFEEAGMELEISTPDHWHLRLPIDTPLPDFAAPEPLPLSFPVAAFGSGSFFFPSDFLLSGPYSSGQVLCRNLFTSFTMSL